MKLLINLTVVCQLGIYVCNSHKKWVKTMARIDKVAQESLCFYIMTISPTNDKVSIVEWDSICFVLVLICVKEV